MDKIQIEAAALHIPEEIVQKWQGVVDILARFAAVPAALIMKVEPPYIRVFRSSDSKGNPYAAQEEAPLNTGLYCETVMSTRAKLLVPDARKDPQWDKNPDIKLGMVSYLGFPVEYPNQEIFGTICVLDNKENTYSKDCEAIMLAFKEIIESHLKLLWQNAQLQISLKAQEESAALLKSTIAETERVNKLFMDREMRIIELKE